LLKKLVATTAVSADVIEQIVDSLLDWQDLDTVPRPNGNEIPDFYGIRNGSMPSISEVNQINGIPKNVQRLLIDNSTLYQAGDFSPYYATKDLLIALTDTNIAAEIIRLRQSEQMTVAKFKQLTGIIQNDNFAFYISNYLQFEIVAEVGESKVQRKMTLKLNRYAQGINKPFNIFISRG
jgi:hypothetical protein